MERLVCILILILSKSQVTLNGGVPFAAIVMHFKFTGRQYLCFLNNKYRFELTFDWLTNSELKSDENGTIRENQTFDIWILCTNTSNVDTLYAGGKCKTNIANWALGSKMREDLYL